MGRQKYRFKTRAEYEAAFAKLEREQHQCSVALIEILNEQDYSGPFDYEKVIREEEGLYKVALIRPLAPDGGTVVIREKTTTHTATYVYEFEAWHKTIQDRIRKGMIPMDSSEWALVEIASRLWDSRRVVFDAEVEKVA